MGDITLQVKAKSSIEVERVVTLYFDTGSPHTFVREDKAVELGGCMQLPKPRVFRALGDGKFKCESIIELAVELEGIWCIHPSYVARSEDIAEEILIGHDFMQKFNIKLDTKKRRPIIDKESLLRAQRIRRNIFDGEKMTLTIDNQKVEVEEERAVKCMRKDLFSCLYYYDFDKGSWKAIPSTNILERAFREVRRRTRSMNLFPDADSCARIMFAITRMLNDNWARGMSKNF